MSIDSTSQYIISQELIVRLEGGSAPSKVGRQALQSYEAKIQAQAFNNKLSQGVVLRAEYSLFAYLSVLFVRLFAFFLLIIIQ